MKKPVNVEKWGRATARERYDSGGVARATEGFTAGAKDWWESGPKRLFGSSNNTGFDNRKALINKMQSEDSTKAADEQPEGR